MEPINEVKGLNRRAVALPFLVITIIFILLGILVVQGVRQHYIEHVEERTRNLAEGYSASIEKALDADQVVRELLHERVILAGRFVEANGIPESHEDAEAVAVYLGVDEINVYDPEGTLLFSSSPNFRNWRIYEGHPISAFLQSGKKISMEEVRENVVTGVRYQYGYYRLQDQKVLQVGVAAEKAADILQSFEISNLMQEIHKNDLVQEASFADRNYLIQDSTSENMVGKIMDDRGIIDAMEQGFPVDYISEDGGTYSIYYPVMQKGSRIGTLLLKNQINTADSFVGQVTLIGLGALTLIFASLLYMVNSTYKRNRKLFRLAYFDQLTGLPNSSYLKRYLESEIRSRGKKKKALMLVNFSNFKTINMTFGIVHGENVLKEIADILTFISPKPLSVFRLSTERFILFVDDYREKEDLILLSQGICEKFQSPFYIEGFRKHLSAQIGIVEIVGNKSADSILKDILVSMNYFDQKVSCGYVFYDQEMQRKIDREEHLEEELREIIEKQDGSRLYAEFQPQFSLKERRIAGYEALARMRSNRYGAISPLEFIDIAEKHHLIGPLGNMILRDACRFHKKLREAGYPEVRVAVNISGLQLLSQEFVPDLRRITDEESMDLENLEVEITESVFIDDFGLINRRLRELSKMKIRIALDDFGTGYSSFFRLREMTVDTLKIDRYFIRRIGRLAEEKILSGEIIAIAHRLNLTVVAEGVEEEGQFNYLKENNCDVIQGYLFSQPLLPDKALDLIKETNEGKKQ